MQTFSKKILNIKDSTDSIQTDGKQFTIADSGSNIVITVNKEFIKSKPVSIISNMITMALSPLFSQQNNQLSSQVTPNIKKFKNIAFFIENLSHYTGGRYSITQQAILLSQYINVTIITNQKPIFLSDFDGYNNWCDVKIIESQNFCLDNVNNEYDLVIGCPITGGLYATEYSQKFNTELYLIIFESPNWINEFIDDAYGDETLWVTYKKCLESADKIWVPSYNSRKYLLEWIGQDKVVDVIYPCINELSAYKNSNGYLTKYSSENLHVCCVSRMADHKNIMTVLNKWIKNRTHTTRKIVLHIIGKVNDQKYLKIKSKMEELGVFMMIHDKITDDLKFEILSKSDLTIYPTRFEGFGMLPLESISVGTPVVSYGLPVLKEVYENSIDYVGSEEQLIEYIINFEKRTVHDDELLSKYSIKNCVDSLLTSLKIPKISVGVIVYNGADYLKYAINSIYKIVNQIIIVEGCVSGYSNNSTSIDGTNDIIGMLTQKENDWMDKITVIRNDKFWIDKIEMQNKIAEKVTGDYYLKLDHDEIWKQQDLIQCIEYLERNRNIDLLRLNFYHFWLNFRTIAVDEGGKWSTKHPRIWRWKPGFHHNSSFNFFEDKQLKKVGSPNYEEGTVPEYVRVYHFGYVRKLDILQNKIQYYTNRKIEPFVQDTVSNWKKGDNTQPTQKMVSSVESFTGQMPEIMINHPYFTVEDLRYYEK